MEEPSTQPSYLTVELLNRAKAIVNGSVLYRRFIDGTPLENDIAVWMADFAGAVRHEHAEHVKEFLNELYAVMVDPCAEGTITVDEIKRQLLTAAIRDRDAVEARRPAEPDGWRPIATAPKDGTRILVAWPNGAVQESYFAQRSNRWNDNAPTAPTHWMPLPVPPSSLPTPEEP